MEFRTKSSKRKKSSYNNFISLKARQNINIIVQPKPILVIFLFDGQKVDVICIYSSIWNSLYFVDSKPKSDHNNGLNRIS